MKNNFPAYCLFFLLIVFGFATRLRAQEPLSFRTVEDRTYHYFLNQQWDSLVAIGKAGIEQDIDYYYLRVRMGIAYYERGHYSQAIENLNKANRFNPDDSTTLKYLYYSYRSFNRPLYQNSVIKRLNVLTQNQILEHFPLHKNCFAPTVGYQFGQAFKTSNDDLIDRTGPNLYGEIDYPLSFMFFGLNYRHDFGCVALNGTYEFFDSQREKKSVTQFENHSSKYNISEHHFYVNTEVSVKNKLIIIPAIQYQLLKYQKFNANWKTDSLKYVFPDSNYTHNNIIASVGLLKDVGVFSLGLSASYSYLYKKSIYQGAFLFTWYPFGNMDLYTTTTLAWMQMPKSTLTSSDASKTDEDKSHPVFEEAIGGRVWKKLWLEAQFACNGLRGYNKANATIVYNSPEQVKYFVGMTAVYSISKVMDILVGYQYSQKVLSGMHYTTFNSFVTDQYLNNSHLIYGGIKWKL